MTHVCRPRPAVPILITRDTWHQRSRRIVTQQLLPSKDGTEQRKRWGYRWSPLWRWRQYAIYDDSTLMKSCIMCHVQKNVRIIAKALYLIEIETGWRWRCEGVLIFIAQCQLGPRSCRVVTVTRPGTDDWRFSHLDATYDIQLSPSCRSRWLLMCVNQPM